MVYESGPSQEPVQRQLGGGASLPASATWSQVSGGGGGGG